MILAKMILAGSLLAIVGATASAQTTPPTQQAPSAETRKGLVTVVNRLNGTIAIREEQGEKDKDKEKEKNNEGEKEKKKDGAGAEGAIMRFKIDHKLSETVHAGDKVKFSVGDGGDPKTEKTITKIETE